MAFRLIIPLISADKSPLMSFKPKISKKNKKTMVSVFKTSRFNLPNLGKQPSFEPKLFILTLLVGYRKLSK